MNEIMVFGNEAFVVNLFKNCSGKATIVDIINPVVIFSKGRTDILIEGEGYSICDVAKMVIVPAKYLQVEFVTQECPFNFTVVMELRDRFIKESLLFENHFQKHLLAEVERLTGNLFFEMIDDLESMVLPSIEQGLNRLVRNVAAMIDVNEWSHRPLDRERLRLLSQRIANDPEAPTNLSSVARQIGTSVSTLNRHFKKEFSTTANRWVISQKLSKARSLIITSSLSIKEIAYECGFNSPSYFIKCYKKKYGCTPSKHSERSMI